MIETGYKPEFSLGALYQGENAAAAQNMQTQEIIQQALANIQKQASFPIEMENKQANTGYMQAMAEKMRRETNDPLKNAQAGSMNLEQFNPLLAGVLANKDDNEFNILLQDPNTPEAVKRVVGQLPIPLRRQFLESYHKNMPINKQVAGIQNTNTKANATLGAAELGYHGKIDAAAIAANAKTQAAAMAKEASAAGQNLDPKKIYGSILMKQFINGEIDQDTLANSMLLWNTAGIQAKPDPSGVSVTVDSQGKTKLTPKPTAKQPTVQDVKKPPVTPQEAAPEHTLADIRKLYPGKSDDELKAAYKKKFNKELK